MTCLADIPRAQTSTHWDQRRAEPNKASELTPSMSDRCLSAAEATMTTLLAGILWVLGATVLAMATHHLATFGLPFGGAR